MNVWKPVFRLLSPGGSRGKLLVFIFHRVLSENDPLLPGEPDVRQFEWMLRLIGKSFNVLPLAQAVELMHGGKLPKAAACITFDDGYKDNVSLALPILQRHGLVATFFIATGFLGGGRMWNDDIIAAVRTLPEESVSWSDFGLGCHDLSTQNERLNTINSVLGALKYLPHGQREATAREIARGSGVDDKSDLMMDADDVRALRKAGMELGGHTSSHPILSSLEDSEAYSEIVRGKTELEKILSERVEVFAYPNGHPKLDLNARHVEMVKEAGFVAAVTTERGVSGINTDPLLMPRFTPWDRTPAKFVARCALALTGRY